MLIVSSIHYLKVMRLIIMGYLECVKEVVSDYLLFSSSKSFDTKIPKLVKEGSSIKIFYRQDVKVVTREFVVAGISTKGELCRLHSELSSRFSSSPSNTIYVKPCRYK